MHADAWSQHPPNYRQFEVGQLLQALGAGECVSLIGLSGMGKSNLLGFIAYRAALADPDAPLCALVDCNRLLALTPSAFYALANRQVASLYADPKAQHQTEDPDSFEALDHAITLVSSSTHKPLALLIDSFDELAGSMDRPFFNSLRALRDIHKFRLAYLVATRRPLLEITSEENLREFHDLFAANQVWVGPLGDSDARWALERFAERHDRHFEEDEIATLLHLSGRHPGLLKALGSTWPEGDPQTPASWLSHEAVLRECQLLWGDLSPEARDALRTPRAAREMIQKPGLIMEGRVFSPIFDAYVATKKGEGLRLDLATGEVYRDDVRLPVSLTAKEHALFAYLLDNTDAVCEKDDLIRAVWPEDKIFERGVRDDSLAQLVRRLRTKIEHDPSQPEYLLTVPGRGYRLTKSLDNSS